MSLRRRSNLADMFDEWRYFTAMQYILGVAMVFLFVKSGSAAAGGRFPEAIYWLLLTCLCGLGAARRVR